MRTRTALFTLSLMVMSVVFISSGVSAIAAQDASCLAFVQTAFDQFNSSCADVPGNSACFGNGASASSSGGSVTGFSKPGDKVDLADIQSVQTQPLSSDASTWGLALLNVHANVPLALSDQGLKFFMMGDVNVENAVDSSSAFTPFPALTVTPLVAANLRSGPSTDAKVLANAPVGTELAADGTSSDGGWLRVLNGDQLAWISKQVVAAKDGDLSTLPVISSNTRTLMQSFFVKMGDTTSTCTGAPPSMLVIQAPGGMNASINVNGVDIRFDGAIVIHAGEDHDMEVIVLGGGANVDGVSLPAGFTLTVPLSDDGHSSNGAATGLRPINDNERAFLTPLAGGIAPNLLYTALSVPTQADVAAILAQLNIASAGQTVSGPASGQAECSRFKPTSPLGGMPLGSTAFYWDAAPGATAYRLNFYGPDGGQINSVDANATTTTIQIDTNGLGAGSNFSWNVDALANGQVACSSGHVSVVRDAFQTVGNGGGGGTQQQDCKYAWQGC
ncbi:MAG: SH3 domain-containing protein [Chloroflexota bacterium]